MNDNAVNELLDTAKKLMEEGDRDLLVFSGSIDSDTGETFIRQLLEYKGVRKKATLYLCTYGGDPHAAYRMARVLRRRYPGHVRILIGSLCKSAGTMIALCADSLGFSDFGELGPLDTQLSRPDEVLQRASGLEVFSTLQYLTDHAFTCFEQNMLTIIRRSGQTVSTRLASEIASKLTTGLLKPITAQLDPYRIGIAQRGLEVTKVYGRQLANVKNLRTNADEIVEHLVKDYPTHAFVIDQEEAKTLFKNVDSFNETEQQLFEQLRAALERPSDDPFIVNFASQLAQQASKEKQEDENAEQRKHNRADTSGGEGQRSQSAPRRKPNGSQAPRSNEGEPDQTPRVHTA
jgi:hypothetical protein